ncbi:MAG TPA: hypothetical protein VNN80_07400 [Polyangiaceae bacterium]|nr:hypothetical protein [Polyangiaceae bacterium]
MISRLSRQRQGFRPRSPRRPWAGLASAVAFGAALWLAPAESQAAPTCTSKPAVCSRVAPQRRAESLVVRAETGRSGVARQVAPTCGTKPSVCARLDARGARPASPPVTLARSDAGARCNTKPAVCARLRVRPAAPPVTLATTAGDVR